MTRPIYKLFIDNIEVAIFYDLEDLTIFIKAMLQRYNQDLIVGFNFTIKEELENDK